MPTRLNATEIEEFIEAAYTAVLRRSADAAGLAHHHGKLSKGALSPGAMLRDMMLSPEYQRLKNKHLPLEALHALHFSRVQIVKQLPKARVIVDVGGGSEGNVDGGLMTMGYKYPFESITILEPPMAQRHAIYKNLAPGEPVEHMSHLGRIKYIYQNMADLSPIADDSVDLVYSGQSVEHVTQDDLEKVFQEVHRVLKPDGLFCFDTPNRDVTEVQLRGTDDYFINPDHKYEYKHHELKAMLERHNYHIDEAKGVTWMPSARSKGVVDLQEMVENYGFFDDIENCYLLYYRARPKK